VDIYDYRPNAVSLLQKAQKGIPIHFYASIVCYFFRFGKGKKTPDRNLTILRHPNDMQKSEPLSGLAFFAFRARKPQSM